MSRYVNITCQYFKVKKYSKEGNGSNDELFDLCDWLVKINGMSLEDLVKDINEVRGRLDSKRKKDNFYCLNFIRMEEYSSTYIVKQNEKAKHVDISIADEEYIGKNTVAIYNPETAIIMVTKNRGGFSGRTIQEYINSFYEEPACYLEPIKLKKDFYNPYSKFGKINIKIESLKDYIPTKGVIYEDALRSALEMSAQTYTFEVGVGRKRNEYLDAEVVRAIISDVLSNMGAVSIARVRMTDEQGTAMYDLFENIHKSTIKMRTDDKGEIEYSKIALEMINTYKKDYNKK